MIRRLTGWVGSMQMVREAAGRWERTAPTGCLAGRPTGWPSTEGPRSRWPRGTWTLQPTGWVMLELRMLSLFFLSFQILFNVSNNSRRKPIIIQCHLVDKGYLTKGVASWFRWSFVFFSSCTAVVIVPQTSLCLQGLQGLGLGFFLLAWSPSWTWDCLECSNTITTEKIQLLLIYAFVLFFWQSCFKKMF